MLVSRSVALFGSKHVPVTHEGHPEFFLNVLVARVHGERAIGHEHRLERIEFFHVFGFHDVLKLVQHHDVVEEVLVVFGVGFFSAFLADHDGLEAFLPCARSNFEGRVRTQNANMNALTIIFAYYLLYLFFHHAFSPFSSLYSAIIFASAGTSKNLRLVNSFAAAMYIWLMNVLS